jgi:MPBQ/MSBQ methyltransferase
MNIRDATQACLGGFREHLVRWPASERRAGRMSPATGLLASLLSRIIAGYFGAITKAYLLASARKPATGRP